MNRLLRHLEWDVHVRIPAAVAIVLAMSATAAAATDWYVDGTLGNDANNCMSPATACKTIQAAINKAASGDTVHVAASLLPYSENVFLNKRLTLLGAQCGRRRPGTGRQRINRHTLQPVDQDPGTSDRLSRLDYRRVHLLRRNRGIESTTGPMTGCRS